MTAAVVPIETALAEALPALVSELRQLAADLSRPKIKDSQWLKAVREKQRALGERVAAIRERLDVQREEFGEKVAQLRERLDSQRSALKATLAQLAVDLQDGTRALAERAAAERAPHPRLAEMRKRFSRAYEDLVAQVKELKIWAPAEEAAMRALRLPRPARTLFHVGSGIGSVLLYQLVVSRAQALTILLIVGSVFAALEITRRFSLRWNDFLVDRVFGLISRPRERYQVNSASYYILAMFVIALAAPKPAVCVALLMLAFGDPAASLVGARWGKRRLYNDKSLLGSVSFFLAASTASVIYLLVAGPALPPLVIFGLVGTTALAGTLTELFSDRIDDNLTVPLICALVATLWL